ncbi:MAG: fibronectin type III domain-containing protein, partial [Robiginitomaculum sp.]|nr:fibronectin type III domain-containing protein [Robiginitomaculum sp.]
ITYTDDNGVVQTITVTEPTTTATITGLTNGNPYTFSVTATNGVPLTSIPATITVIPLGAPDAINDLAATVADKSTVLTWTAPALDGSGAINFYTISYNDDNGILKTVQINAPAEQTTISSLTNGIEYSFTITSTNVNGNTSTVSNSAIVTPLGAPDTINDLSPTAGDKQVSFIWSEPGLNNSGDVVTYTITYDDIDGIEQSATINAPTTTATITGLTNNHEYSFTITATNGVPLTSITSTPVLVTPLGAPDKMDPLVPLVGDRQVTLSWIAPELNDSGAILYYTITYIDINNDEQTIQIDPLETSHTITGLTNGHQYSFTITATNDNNLTSVPSDPTLVTPATTPEAPTIVAAIRGNQQVKLDWKASADDGGDLLTQFTVEWSSNNFVDISSTTVTVSPPATNPLTTYTTTATGLVNGDIYQFRVYSHNAYGSSVASTPVSVTPATFPDAPTLNTAERGDTSVTLTWTPNGDGGDSIDSFRIEASTAQDFTAIVADFTIIDPAATSTPVPGLTNGITYYFRVFVTNDVGESISSNELSQTPATVPGIPLNVVADPASNQVTITWTAPSNDGGTTVDDGGSAIEFYVVKYRTSESAWTEIQTIDATILSVVVDGLANGTPYYFEVYAENDVGPGDESDSVTAIPATAPSAPQNLDATPQTGQVLVNWEVPTSNGGAEITSYTVKWSVGNTFDSNIFDSIEITGVDANTPPVTTTTITGLTNGETYTFVVTATNSAGESGSSNEDTATPAAAPDAPTLDSAKSDDDSSSVLSWTANSDGGSSIVSYSISYTPVGSEAQPVAISGSPLATTATISGLTNGIEYSFTITASNIVATSDSSNPLTAIPSTNPSAPTGLTVTGTGNQSVSLSWTEPVDDGGDPLVKYTVQYSTDDFTTIQTHEVIPVGEDPLATSTTVGGLDNGVEYKFRVLAHNEADVPEDAIDDDTSIASGEVPATSSTVPLAPTLDSATSDNDSSSTLSWTANFDGGSPIVSYSVSYTPTGSEVQPVILVDNTFGTTVTIGGLTNGVEYTFSVIASNANGPSDSSIPISATPAAKPSAPVLDTPVRGDQSVSLDWTLPSDGGSSITLYTITYTPAGGASQSEIIGNDEPLATQATIGSLNNGVLYTFTIIATNALGNSPASNPETATPATIPKAPEQLTATFGDSSVTLTWQVPSDPLGDGGESITDYTVEYREKGDTDWIVFTDGVIATPQPTVVNLLTNGKTYEFQVSAKNIIGTGPTSNIAEAKPATTSNAPVIDSVTPISDIAIDLTWSEPIELGGGTVLGYQIERSIENGAFATIVDDTENADLIYHDTGLLRGTLYTYKVTAITEAGPGDASGTGSATTFDVPDAPVINSIISANGAVDLTWSEPSTGGTPITGYLVEYTTSETDANNGVFSGSKVVSSSTLATTVTGLDNGVTYYFVVSATNSVDYGDKSAIRDTTPATVPDKPLNLVATPGDEFVTLTFDPPGDNGGATIVDYNAEYSTDGTNWTPFDDGADSTALEIIVTPLSNGLEYHFRVIAYNGVVPGSDPSDSVTTTPASTSGVPTNLAATRGNGEVALTWLGPDVTGGAPITSYIVEYTDDPAGVFGDTPSSVTVSAPADPAELVSTTVDGLTNGVTYTFQVKAVNTAGTSAASDTDTAKPATNPSSPTITTLTSGDTQIKVDWNTPSDGGEPITSYRLEWSTVSDFATTLGSETIGDDESLSTTFTVTGLLNGDTYYFRVFSTNVIGDSLLSSNVESAIPVSTPSQVTGLAAVRGSGEVTLSWFVPFDGGSTIDYYVIEYSSDDFATTLTSQVDNPIATGDPPFITSDVENLANGTPYKFRVYAHNLQGNGPTSDTIELTPATVPGAPTNVVTQSGNTSVRLDWTAPEQDGGADLDYYLVQYRVQGTTSWTDATGQSLDTFKEISGLSNGSVYEFQVIAHNDVGNGAASSPIVEETPAGPPSAPVITNVAGSDITVTVTWDSSTADGAPVTTYDLEYSSDNFKNDIQIITITAPDASVTSISETVSPLINGESYSFRVIANSDANSSPYSNTVDAVPFTVSNAPTDLVATRGNGEVTLEWNAPGFNGGSIITKYVVEYSIDNYVIDTSIKDNITPTDDPITTVIDGLANGSLYTFRVVAVNAAGSSTPSDTDTATPATVPGAPTLTEANRGDTTVSLIWSAPLNAAGDAIDNGGDAIVDYEIQFRVLNSGAPWETFVETGQSTATTAIVDSLTNGNTYEFTISAINSVGTGPVSNIETAKPATVPGIPNIERATSGNGLVELVWTQPSSGGEAITGYTITISPADNNGVSSQTVSAPSLTTIIGDLTNGVQYTFTVAAENVVNLGIASNPATVTPATVPGIPTELNAQTQSGSEIRLTWTAPSDNRGSPITGYQIERQTGSGSFIIIAPDT